MIRINSPLVLKMDGEFLAFVFMKESHIAAHTRGGILWLDILSCKPIPNGEVINYLRTKGLSNIKLEKGG